MAAFAATGVILSATYMLWMFQRVNYGPVTNEKNARAAGSAAARVGACIVPIVAVAVLMGVLPNLFLRPIGTVGRADAEPDAAGAPLASGVEPSPQPRHPLECQLMFASL